MRYYTARIIGIIVFIILLKNKEYLPQDIMMELSKYHLAWLLPLGIAFLVIILFEGFFRSWRKRI